jgi:hypothetical protein
VIPVSVRPFKHKLSNSMPFDKRNEIRDMQRYLIIDDKNMTWQQQIIAQKIVDRACAMSRYSGLPTRV